MAWEILEGDCIEQLATMKNKSVHCCITSPPYYAQRDYGVDGQIGLEGSPREYVEQLTKVFREVGRVLRDDGTLFLNLGDGYFSKTKGHTTPPLDPRYMQAKNVGAHMKARKIAPSYGLKAKDLMGLPWRVALALQEDGFYLRQDIVWEKPYYMPEGDLKDRCSKSHEYVFLLTKSASYFFNASAIKEKQRGKPPASEAHKAWAQSGLRNRRSVWRIAPSGFKDAHFATMPPALVALCLRAGCPPGGTVLDPFAGSGTVLLVADRLQRNGIGIELNPEYAELARKRIWRGIPTKKVG